MVNLSVSVALSVVLSSSIAGSVTAGKYAQWKKYYNNTHNNNHTDVYGRYNSTYPYDDYPYDDNNSPNRTSPPKNPHPPVSSRGSSDGDFGAPKRKRSSNKSSSKADGRGTRSSNRNTGQTSTSSSRTGTSSDQTSKSSGQTSRSSDLTSRPPKVDVCADITCYAFTTTTTPPSYYHGDNDKHRRRRNCTDYYDGNYTHGDNHTYYDDGGRYNKRGRNYTDYDDKGRRYYNKWGRGRNDTYYDGGRNGRRKNYTDCYDYEDPYYPPNYTQLERCCCVTYPYNTYKCAYLFDDYQVSGMTNYQSKREQKTSSFSNSKNSSSNGTKRNFSYVAYGYSVALLLTAAAATIGWRKRSQQRDEKAEPLGSSRRDNELSQIVQKSSKTSARENYVRAA